MKQLNENEVESSLSTDHVKEDPILASARSLFGTYDVKSWDPFWNL